MIKQKSIEIHVPYIIDIMHAQAAYYVPSRTARCCNALCERPAMHATQNARLLMQAYGLLALAASVSDETEAPHASLVESSR